MVRLTAVPSAGASREVDSTAVDTEPTPMPAALHEAWLYLAGAAVVDPNEHALVYAAADALVDVYPPYPPAVAAPTAVPPAEAVDAARALLLAAAADSTAVEERLRIARVLRILSRRGSTG